MRRFLLAAALLLGLGPVPVAREALASDWYQFTVTASGSSVNSCSVPFTMGAGGSWSIFCSAAMNLNTHCTDLACSSPSCAATTNNIPLAANQVFTFSQAQNEAGIAVIGTGNCKVAAHYPSPPG